MQLTLHFPGRSAHFSGERVSLELDISHCIAFVQVIIHETLPAQLICTLANGPRASCFQIGDMSL